MLSTLIRIVQLAIHMAREYYRPPRRYECCGFRRIYSVRDVQGDPEMLRKRFAFPFDMDKRKLAQEWWWLRYQIRDFYFRRFILPRQKRVAG